LGRPNSLIMRPTLNRANYSLQKEFLAVEYCSLLPVVPSKLTSMSAVGVSMLVEREEIGGASLVASLCTLDTAPFAVSASDALQSHDRLTLPLAKAAWIEPSASAAAPPTVTFWHRGHEIVFDDPRQFAFARGLATAANFAAHEAAAWSGLSWNETAGLLTELVSSGVLIRGEGPPSAVRHDSRPMPDPLVPAPQSTPRAWTDAASLMAALTGTALDSYWLEAVVPVFRVAHCFLDADGRQVGEANTFPPETRLAIKTDWRGCPYRGNRYQADKPMNATSLKVMRIHWRQILALLDRMRTAYLERCPEARAGWTIGHVERLTCAVLALPSLLLLRQGDNVANGSLHPALSSLFRVTDGVRLVMHQMLFVPTYEPMHSPDESVDAATILAYADRNFSFHSEHAVCAGPQFMIEDMLGVLLEGREPKGGMAQALEPDLEAVALLADCAIDYAFLGLETFGTVFSLWPAMTRTYARLHRLLHEADSTGGGVAKLAKRFAGHFEALATRSFLADESWREHREAVYDDMVAHCRESRTGKAAATRLSTELVPSSEQVARHAGAQQRLAQAIGTTLGKGNSQLAESLAAEIIAFLLLGQLVIAGTDRVQAETARLLGRPAPTHRLTLDQLNLHNVLMGADVRSLPFLPDEIGRCFGISIDVNADTIAIREPVAAAP
jgi:hypothetical protein